MSRPMSFFGIYTISIMVIILLVIKRDLALVMTTRSKVITKVITGHCSKYCPNAINDETHISHLGFK